MINYPRHYCRLVVCGAMVVWIAWLIFSTYTLATKLEPQRQRMGCCEDQPDTFKGVLVNHDSHVQPVGGLSYSIFCRLCYFRW